MTTERLTTSDVGERENYR